MEIHKVQKSGNSYYVTIPRQYLNALGIKPKEHVYVMLLKNSIQIMAVPPKEGLDKCKKKKK